MDAIVNFLKSTGFYLLGENPLYLVRRRRLEVHCDDPDFLCADVPGHCQEV